MNQRKRNDDFPGSPLQTNSDSAQGECGLSLVDVRGNMEQPPDNLGRYESIHPNVHLEPTNTTIVR